MSTSEEFEKATSWLRPELIAHCYRMLGSVTEAEDQVQETYLKAWQAFHSFEGRSSVRTWMYRIATNICLNALSSASRRVLPTGLGQPAGNPEAPLRERQETWLEPLPDTVVWGSVPPDPQTCVVARDGVGLATIAALQELPPKQRAVLVLREVLEFSAAETAEIVGTGVAAVNSAVQRARATIGPGLTEEGRHASDLDDRERAVWEEFCAAFDGYDVEALTRIMAEQATWEMPPFDRFYVGPTDIATLISLNCPAEAPGDLRMVPCVVNARPAAGMYLRDDSGQYRPFQLVCLEIVDSCVSRVVGYFDTGLFLRAMGPSPGEPAPRRT